MNACPRPFGELLWALYPGLADIQHALSMSRRLPLHGKPSATPGEVGAVRRRIRERIEGKDTPPPLGWPTPGADRGEGKDGEGGK